MALGPSPPRTLPSPEVPILIGCARIVLQPPAPPLLAPPIAEPVQGPPPYICVTWCTTTPPHSGRPPLPPVQKNSASEKNIVPLTPTLPQTTPPTTFSPYGEIKLHPAAQSTPMTKGRIPITTPEHPTAPLFTLRTERLPSVFPVSPRPLRSYKTVR